MIKSNQAQQYCMELWLESFNHEQNSVSCIAACLSSSNDPTIVINDFAKLAIGFRVHKFYFSYLLTIPS